MSIPTATAPRPHVSGIPDWHSYSSRSFEKVSRDFLDMQGRYSARAVRVFLALKQIGRGRPSFKAFVNDIARITNQTHRTIQRALHELEQNGWIERHFNRRNPTRHGATTYRLDG